jgi:signal transduction histidine kinase
MQGRLWLNGKSIEVLVGLLILLGLYRISLDSYLLFHSLAEIFSIVIACGIFMIAWNARRFLDNNYLLFIGIAYLFVGGIDLIHTLAYKGMGVFQGYGTNPATQLWIAARYMESLSLLFAPFLLSKKLKVHLLFAVYALATTLLLFSIFQWKIFPVCFVEGSGLTPFKKVSEYIISVILLASVFSLLRHREQFDRKVLIWVLCSIMLTIGSELAFTFYINAYGFSNLVGHFFKIMSFYLIYRALIETGLARPYNLLFRSLKQREEALQQRTLQLETANSELDAFSYSVSHDLRAPLRTIDGFSLALLEDYAERLDETGKDYLQRIRSGSQNMGQLIDDLLNLSRISRRQIQRKHLDLSALVRDIATKLKQQAPQRQVEITISEGIRVEADPGLLRVGMENLLNNAWKFTGKRDAAKIKFGVDQRDGMPVYFIRDNGVGFDMAYVDKLFGAFQRLHGRAEFPGTGIGLATVRRIIHRHGGRIWAEGEIHKGATFYFTLPKGEPHGKENHSAGGG